MLMFRDPAVRPQITRFVLIALIFIAVQIVALLIGAAAIEAINSTRSYAVGESFYAKRQKEAVLSLHRYVEDADPRHYEAFLTAISVPIGDRLAREELERTDRYDEIVYNGFLQGANDPSDIPGLARLFIWCHWWEPFARAVDDWRHGDKLVNRLSTAGNNLNQMIEGGMLTTRNRDAILHEVDDIDHDLTALEESFSKHMGEAARTAKNLVILGLGVSSLVLWTIAVAFAWRTFRRGIEAGIRRAESEQRFKDFAEVASDWFWETGPDQRITYISDRFASATGAQPEEFVGRTAVEKLEPMAAGDEREHNLADIEARLPFRGWTYRRLLPDGSEQYWKISGTPVFDAAGKFAGYRGTGSNITAEILNQINLAAAKEQAEMASMAKSEFLANMSHELRTPLNSILGFAQLLEYNTKDPLTPKQSRQAAQIQKSGQHLLSLIDDVLDLSRIETGNIKLSLEPVALGPVVDQVRAVLQPLADEARLTLTMRFVSAIPPVRADRTRLAQILMNLGTNAIKYNRAGGIVTMLAEFVEPDRARISVIDTGIGIAPQRLPELFQPFNRLGAEASAIEGTGIGLSITKKLIELMKGTIEVRSNPEQGTTFIVELPVIVTQPEEEVRPAHALEGPLSARHAGFTMLYVEDNPSNIRLMEELVDTMDGIRLIVATEPRSGLALASTRQPDVIVLDINLPGMSGVEMLETLKADPATAAIPVLALSAAAMPREIERGKAAGFAHYLTKPIDIQAFLAAIDDVLGVQA